jgi:hypothetical protein
MHAGPFFVEPFVWSQFGKNTSPLQINASVSPAEGLQYLLAAHKTSLPDTTLQMHRFVLRSVPFV